MIVIARGSANPNRFLVAKAKGHPLLQVGKVVDLELEEVQGGEFNVQSILSRGYWADPGKVTDDELADLKRISGYVD